MTTPITINHYYTAAPPRGGHPLLQAEKLVLVAGHSLQPPTHTGNCRYVQTGDAAAAKTALMDVLRVSGKAPAAIIYPFNSRYETCFAEWAAFFAAHQALRFIPFFLYSEQVPDALLKDIVKRHAFIDEIITNSCLPQLEQKIAFVAKFKRLRLFSKGVEKKPGLLRRPGHYLKRGTDILLASIILLLLSPLMALIALLIRLESKGPVFYTAQRAGKNYKVFRFYKFRTMIPGADKQLKQLSHLNQYGGNGTVFYKVSNDPRVTRFGAFLRNTSLDELPQLLNVIKGDMSLVGNRPLPLYEAAGLTTDSWAQRFLAPAGITGLWQISKRGKKEMSAEERIGLDINYAEKHSFAYDMWIIASTPKALVQKDNV